MYTNWHDFSTINHPLKNLTITTASAAKNKTRLPVALLKVFAVTSPSYRSIIKHSYQFKA
jgi:hypothetical protein